MFFAVGFLLLLGLSLGQIPDDPTQLADNVKSWLVWAFVLLCIGTLGLLLNEFVFAWGSAATLIFAACNVVGLVGLASMFRRQKQGA